jgi:tRNA 2-thiouridine synthesizing protein B
MLFIINQSPCTADAFTQCSQYVTTDSDILLIENGVYTALTNSQFSKIVEEILQQVKIYALHADVTARGLTDKILPGIKLASYSDFVDLTAKHKQIISWG